MDNTVIDVKNLSCKSGVKYLLKDINWSVTKGQHWAVFGMNGSGKTTLLSIIAGFKKYTHGELAIFGEPYNKENILNIRKRIGWVSSSFFDRYFKKESALNIVLSGKFGTFGIDHDVSDADIKKAQALLSELHISEKIDQPFYQLSKGERQNVIIARALFSNPDILVLDEPSSGLDVFARAHLLNTVRDLAEKTNVTIIYVTHYTEEILDIFENCLLLKNGQVCGQGRTNDLFTDEKISELLDFPVAIEKKQGTYQVNIEAFSNIQQLLERGEQDDWEYEYGDEI